MGGTHQRAGMREIDMKAGMREIDMKAGMREIDMKTGMREVCPRGQVSEELNHILIWQRR